MKGIFVSLAIALCTAAAVAQPGDAPKVLAELSVSSQAMKGAPFSADTVSESVQTLSDGNRIVQSSTGKIHRNGEGKVRREMTGGHGGTAGFAYGFGGVSIMDPFGGQNVWLNSLERTARTMTLMPSTALRVKELSDEQKKLVEKYRVENKVSGTASTTVDQQRAVEEVRAVTLPRTPVAATPLMGNGFFYQGGNAQKWETKNDELGTQNIEGVTCEGTRRTTTIPAGAIGNERPIEITYERWYSKELGMVVMSKHNDPRFGEQTYTLKNIVRVEPDPSLFTVPSGFRVFSEAAPSGVYTTTVKSRTLAPAQAPKQP